MKKILLIENDERLQGNIKQAINSKFGRELVVYPAHVGGEKESFEYNGYLIGKIVESPENFDAVFNYYKDVDLYIIDVSLIGNRSRHGLDFCKYLLEQKNKDFEIIVVSNNRQNDEILGKVRFINKFDKGAKFFVPDLMNDIRELLKMDNLSSDLAAKNNNKVATFLHELWEWMKYQADRALDKFIFIVFYILATGAAFYACKHILGALFLSQTNGQNQLLTTAEEMFVSLLPLFIVLGFFKYYRQNVRITLLGGGVDEEHEDSSTRTMNLAKILFISSITSYTIIRVLALIFEEQAVDKVKVIAAVSFLIILMIYFIFLDRKKH